MKKAFFHNKNINKSNIEITHLENGLTLQRNGKVAESISAFKKVLEKNPKNYLARLNLGLSYLLNNEPFPASKTLHLLHEERPEDIDVLRLCGNAYAKLGHFDIAIKFYKRVINLNKDDYETWLDLTYAAAAGQQNTEALYYATQAIALKPEDPRAHLNLGGALNGAGRLDDAMYCFETVLQLESNNISAMSNIALIHEKKGNHDAALDQLKKCTKLVNSGSQQEAELFYKMSYPLLYKGDLKNGWAMYEYGFAPNNSLSRGPKRKFNIPKWEGQPIHGKRLLVWREQGLGDELMFLHALPEAFNLCEDIIVECESRLASLFQRSFPNCTVRAQNFSPLSGYSEIEDFDYHIPAGSLMNIFRLNISDFSHGKNYLVPDPSRVSEFKQRLEPFKSKKLVGICWRSGNVSVERNIYYAPITSWVPVFETENVAFVNLQYGDCSQEVESIKQEFGIELLQWPDIDLRNDLESVAALIANLDCVVSVGTAVAQLTGAVGTPLLLLTSKDWSFLGQNYYPWFQNVDVCCSDFGQPIEPLIPEMAAKLESFLA